MKLNSEELRSLYQGETARSNRRSDSQCLTEEVLARAVAGELDQAERERMADHLASCSDCAKEYGAARSIKAWADENAPARPIPFPAEANGHHHVLLEPRRWSLHLPYAIAASLLVLSLLLGALLISKSHENQRLVAETTNRHTAETS